MRTKEFKDLLKLRCQWPMTEFDDPLVRRVTACRFKARHLIGRVGICNPHFRMIRRYVEAHR